MKSIAVVIDTIDPLRAAEALRAAVGLTLRGARVSVVPLHPLDAADPRVRRPLSTLRSLGHLVDAPLSSLSSADAVEVWT